MQHHKKEFKKPVSLPIAQAPKDGTHIYVIRPSDGKLFEAYWEAEGDSWVDGKLQVTGSWFCEVGGWFQPDEVERWIPKDIVDKDPKLVKRVVFSALSA